MTKKPTHLNHEPKELGPEPADITGKEPVLVLDWDQESLTEAILLGQRDIMEQELAYLLESPYWQKPRDQEFEHVFKKVPADIADATLERCRLDNIPVYQQQLVEMRSDPDADTARVTPAQVESIEEQIDTRFLAAAEHLDQRVHDAGPRLTQLMEE